MPFVPKSELESLRTENDHMREQLGMYDEMLPLLRLAEELRDELTDRVVNDPLLSAEQIGEIAYKKVLASRIDEARDEAAAKYEKQHRRSLYERLLGEIAVSEGGTISEKVRNRVETDPELAVELRNSARKELAARATNVVRSEITAEQQVIVDKEAERQIELDRLDVEFALEGKLDIGAENLKQWIRPGDKVDLFYGPDEAKGKRRDAIRLTWTRDGKGNEGWVYTSCSGKLVNNSGYDAKIDSARFVYVGSLSRDLEAGKELLQEDMLAAGVPVALLRRTADGAAKAIDIKSRPMGNYGTYSGLEPVVLRAVDFQTRDIEFVEAA